MGSILTFSRRFRCPSPPNPANRIGVNSENAKPGWFRRLGAAGPVAIVLSFWPPLGGFVLLAFLTRLGPWLRAHDGEGIAIYFLLTGFLMGISFLPTYSCAILAGWAFGFAVGWPLAMVTITVASLLAYAIGRWITRDHVIEVIRERAQWNAIHHSLLGSTFGRTMLVVTLLRVPPASPFALANFVLAAARVPFFEYTMGTLVGVAPRTALATFAAAGLEQLRFKNVADTWTVVGGIVVTIGVCVVLGMLANRALKEITDRWGPGGA
ncbi:MAG: TVP38/TMEM64 family protein [Opitutus sp.]|nr:TVP38/TMEM64 family protein [Opitutus sp.]